MYTLIVHANGSPNQSTWANTMSCMISLAIRSYTQYLVVGLLHICKICYFCFFKELFDLLENFSLNKATFSSIVKKGIGFPAESTGTPLNRN